MTNPTLDLIRDKETTVTDLAAHFQQSEAYAVGCMDAVDGGQDWGQLFFEDMADVSAADKADYAAGFAFGLAVLEGRDEEAEARAIAEGWEEAYGLAATAAASHAFHEALEALPVSDDDIPW